MASKNYCVNKHFQFTPEQAKTLTEKAKEAGVNEAAYLRSLIGQKPKDFPEIRIAIANLTTEVNRIGHNINQIVHNNNPGLYSELDKRQLIAYMRKLNDAVNEVVRSIGSK